MMAFFAMPPEVAREYVATTWVIRFDQVGMLVVEAVRRPPEESFVLRSYMLVRDQEPEIRLWALPLGIPENDIPRYVAGLLDGAFGDHPVSRTVDCIPVHGTRDVQAQRLAERAGLIELVHIVNDNIAGPGTN